MTLGEMRQILADHGLQLTRSLGQSFLHDGNQLRRIVAQAELQPTDTVLEIGPGLGPLTELLLPAAARVVAIEKDARLFGFLAVRFATQPKLELIHADALERLRAAPAAWDGWKLVANLPYSVASPILVELALATRVPERCIVTVQLEVARRLAASPGTKDYGVLSLLVQQRYAPAGLFRIPATCFLPAPEVESACITLERRPANLLDDTERRRFVRLVRRAFSERRKMMFKLLKHDWPEADLRAAFDATAVPVDTRAERVPLDRFVALTRHLQPPATSLPSYVSSP
jgi:16S rRNA (adenine1518-N6/adenine1519-N6)-dimethyltransferase